MNKVVDAMQAQANSIEIFLCSKDVNARAITL